MTTTAFLGLWPHDTLDNMASNTSIEHWEIVGKSSDWKAE